ncbi:MAG: DUF6377 domain-containing protein [Bacteroidales bacterium]
MFSFSSNRMNPMTKFLSLTIILLTITFSITANSVDSVLTLLDRTISQSEAFVIEREKRIEALRRVGSLRLSKQESFRVYSSLSDEYRPYIIDSSLFYAVRALEVARQINSDRIEIDAKLQLSIVYNIAGMYKESSEIISSIKASDLIDKQQQITYFHTQTELNRYLNIYSIKNNLTPDYNKLRQANQDSILQIIDSTSLDFSSIKAERLLDEKEYEEAKILISNNLTALTPDDRPYAYTAYNMAEVLQKEGQLEMAKYYLAIAAISDIRCAVKENAALYTLALQLYEEGDLERAYKYIIFSLEDALFSNAKLRTIEVLRILPVIDQAYRQESVRSQRLKNISFTIISLLTCILITILILLQRRKNQLQKAHHLIELSNQTLNELNSTLLQNNQKISQFNQRLSKANTLQEEYIARYLKLCSAYIGKIDNYRRSILKQAQIDKREDLIKSLKSKEVTERELTEFYQEFDNTFLDLYPDFVEQFNRLLQPDEQIILKNGELMNTELRIFALVRLGVVESSQIAEFLRYSITTIYNYRTRMRNKAIGMREEFESEVQKIGKKEE